MDLSQTLLPSWWCLAFVSWYGMLFSALVHHVCTVGNLSYGAVLLIIDKYDLWEPRSDVMTRS